MKVVRRGTRHLALAGALMGACLATGCDTVHDWSLTYRLWDSGEFRRFDEPAPDPKLALFQSPDGRDVLVEYDSLPENRDTPERRAYWLRTGQSGVADRRKPEFISPAATNGLAPIPVIIVNSQIAAQPAQTVPYAVCARGGRSFLLFETAAEGQSIDLPVYQQASGNAMKLALTPLAVTGDTLMVGGGVAVVGAIAYCEARAGAPITWPSGQ
jgi:hypothetical protein